MSANFHGSSFRSRRRRHLQRPAPMDLDTTADVHEENTTDLEPATADISPADMPRPTLADAAQPRAHLGLTPEAAAREPAASPDSKVSPALTRVTAGPVDAVRAENSFVARPTESPADSTGPILAGDTPTTEPTKLREVIERAPLPFGRREPSVSAPAAKNSSLPDTVDVTSNRLPADVKPAATVAPSAPPARKLAALKAIESPRPALTPGKVLCDRYLLEQVIGCGGTAIVFRARDMLSAKGSAPNLQVAIKTPRPELGEPERAAQRLKHEFDHARLLSHPSIVRVLELHQDEGRSFMTMELVQGKLLSQLLRDWTMLPVSLAHKILRQCAEALQYAHSQNVVHGDFKPGNVFITPEEGVRIVDFGTAAGPLANESRIPAGTPTYASPEVLSGETPEPRDDVFSFACVAYELLTGQHPFGRQSSLQARDEAKIPPRAWNLSTAQWLSLLSALSWKREQRPTSIEDLLTRLTPDQSVAAAPAPIHVDAEEIVPAELPADLMPKQRSWGFFAFIACALLVTYFAFQRQTAQDAGKAPPPLIVPAASSLPGPAPVQASQPEVEAAKSAPVEQDAAAAPVAAAPLAAAKPRPAAAPVSEITFESSSIVTSESSVAAVFLIKRSQPLAGRISVSWKAVSGSADAGIDFASEASGTVTFADGQAQRAIYVPLRNDLLKEQDESFYIELFAPKSARLGKTVRAEAIIRDDD
ncbi:MAG: protein kinase [Pseudomonadota bacterium]|nr:protein kinase [Pseudomonadota bacterium]